MNIGCFSFPFSLFLSSPPPPNRTTLPSFFLHSQRVCPGKAGTDTGVGLVGVLMTVGFVSRQPPQGLQGKKDLPPLPQRKKKGRTKPQSGTTLGNAIETSKPCERFHKKTKSISHHERTALRGREPGFSELQGS